MGSCRSPLTKRSKLGLLLTCALWLPGCVLGSDSDPPVLSVDFLWDRSPKNEQFSTGSCGSAGVIWMDWELKDDKDNTVARSDEGGHECQDGLDFVDVGPGRYTLSIHGFNADDQMLWSSTCKKLVLERFDLVYQCQVPQSEP